MGSIRITETSQVGEVYSTVEYEFSDASDFFAWDEIKRETINNAVKNFVGGLYGENPLEDQPADNVTEIKVAKKAKEPTKH
jgi:hypothetical protein